MAGIPHSQAADTSAPEIDISMLDMGAMSQLKSHEHRDLLDAIDKLRCANISSTEISIPQIVVCGDQSSGKSSVLEAIAQVNFPIGSGTTTKFATELVLRNDPNPRAYPRVNLHASADRNEADKKYIESFTETVTDICSPTKFRGVVERAAAHMLAREPERRFWHDRLRVEISSPELPHLTLVDLPGLIHVEGKNANANPGDMKGIRQMIQRYLRDSRTIILAVVNAQNDADNQEIIQLIKDTGNAKDRAIGVFTKPDGFNPDSDQAKNVAQFIRNQVLQLGLGWHVLKNLPHEESDRSPATRDSKEREYLSRGEWSTLDRRDVGIAALREKLSFNLMDRIKNDLPSLISEMYRKQQDCINEQSSLGPARDTLDAQREHLVMINGKLQRLIESALDGDFDKPEHADFFDGSRNRNLRSMINRESEDFANKIRTNGRQFKIYIDESDLVRYVIGCMTYDEKVSI